ncbi:hypothetical protein RSAG8_04533, partial [Rhizoctonia solani AG-8 WAC10335]
MTVPGLHSLRQPLLNGVIPCPLARTSGTWLGLHIRCLGSIPAHGSPRVPTLSGLARRSFATPVDITPGKLIRPIPDLYIYERILSGPVSVPLSRIHTEYRSHAGRVLDVQLPYESRPDLQRRVKPSSDEGDGIVLVAHLAVTKAGRCRVSLGPGFALDFDAEGKGEQCVVTCCHSLEQANNANCISWRMRTAKWPLRLSYLGESDTSYRHSSLPRHDILLLSIPHTNPRLRTLPVSPYPAPNDGSLSVRLLSSHGQPKLPSHDETGEWTAWLDGFALQKWVVGGKVLGYRDLAGRESRPGTYDPLSHMLFNILPTPGSSGAPLVDEHGAVVGMALGTRMDNRVEGNRGWGVPAELIYEMFSLPGLKLNKK